MPYRFRDFEGQVEERFPDLESLLKRCKDILMHRDRIYDPYAITCAIADDKKFLGWEHVYVIRFADKETIGYSDVTILH